MNDTIVVTANTYKTIVNNMREHKKIGAIKALRTETGLRLREAKEAVEKLAYTKGFTSMIPGQPGVWNPSESAGRIVAWPVIKKVTVDLGEGPVQVDIETLQMKILTELGSIGLDTCADMLRTVEVLRALNEGKTVDIKEDVEEEDTNEQD